MMKEQYQSPLLEEIGVAPECAILGTSSAGLDDYNNQGWNW